MHRYVCAHRCPHLRRDWARICPHLRRDWAHPGHVCRKEIERLRALNKQLEQDVYYMHCELEANEAHMTATSQVAQRRPRWAVALTAFPGFGGSNSSAPADGRPQETDTLKQKNAALAHSFAKVRACRGAAWHA